MVIAQALVENGLLSALVDGVYLLPGYIDDALRSSPFIWVGLGLGLFGLWKLISR
jgi:hypothetical protein